MNQIETYHRTIINNNDNEFFNLMFHSLHIFIRFIYFQYLFVDTYIYVEKTHVETDSAHNVFRTNFV